MTISEPLAQDHPKVSVCVITYNQQHYIRDCLESLVSQQTDFRFEIIVGDDCSTDGTRDIIDEFVTRYPDLVRACFQPVNTGGSRNNLEVHAAARGDYVAHLDGDDYALQGKLQAQADALDQDPDCTAVWHPVDFFDDAGNFCKGQTSDLSVFPNGRVSFGAAIRMGYVGVYSALMYRRSALTPLDTSRKLLDLYFTWDTLSKGHGRMLDGVFGRYRVMSSGSLQVKSLSRVRRLAIEHAQEFLQRCPDHRRDFVIWAVSCALILLKNRQSGISDYFCLAWQARQAVGLRAIMANLNDVRNLRVKWRTMREPIAAVAEIRR